MAITTEEIKKLRDQTSISIMECKKALEEAEGDFDRALSILKKKSVLVAQKKAEREIKEGLVVIKTKDKKMAAVVLGCETDFVAKNEDFIALANNLAEKVLAEGVDKVKKGAEGLINPVIQKTGENIQLGEIDLVEGETLGAYVHNGKIGAIVSLSGGTPELAKEVAMQVSAMNPEFLSLETIPDKDRREIQEIFGREVTKMDKPEEIKEKILKGKVESYFKERTLLEQPFIKDEEKTVRQLLEEAGAEIKEFKRYTL